jgi:ABC-type phosphate/phosphonate transport system permease subunit
MVVALIVLVVWSKMSLSDVDSRHYIFHNSFHSVCNFSEALRKEHNFSSPVHTQFQVLCVAIVAVVITCVDD